MRDPPLVGAAGAGGGRTFDAGRVDEVYLRQAPTGAFPAALRGIVSRDVVQLVFRL